MFLGTSVYDFLISLLMKIWKYSVIMLLKVKRFRERRWLRKHYFDNYN